MFYMYANKCYNRAKGGENHVSIGSIATACRGAIMRKAYTGIT